VAAIGTESKVKRWPRSQSCTSGVCAQTHSDRVGTYYVSAVRLWIDIFPQALRVATCQVGGKRGIECCDSGQP